MSITEQPAAQQGWICPKCGTVWAPWQPCCTICGDNRTTFATGMSTEPWVTVKREDNLAAKPKHSTGFSGLEDNARWVKSDIPNEKWKCSHCGAGCWYYDYEATVCRSRWCPSCGAKMDGDDNNG